MKPLRFQNESEAAILLKPLWFQNEFDTATFSCPPELPPPSLATKKRPDGATCVITS